MLNRSITLPIEAGAAIHQTLGILDDHGQQREPMRAALLEQRVWDGWTNEEWTSMAGDDAAIEFEIEDAAILLDGLAFTEMMSADLPWFDMVRWTVDFMTDQLRSAWTDAEWKQLGAGT